MGLDPPRPSVPRRTTVATCSAGPSASPGSRSSPAGAGLAAGGWFRRHDAVIAMSPPLTLGLTGRLVAWSHRAPLVFNIQDVFPDAAVETGAIIESPGHRRGVLARAADLPPRRRRHRACPTTCAATSSAKLAAARSDRVRTIPNFVDTDAHPAGRSHDAVPARARHRRRTGRALRRQRRVLAVAGAARRGRPPAARRDRARSTATARPAGNWSGAAAGLANVRFAGYVPDERLAEVLATGDIHAVPLRRAWRA